MDKKKCGEYIHKKREEKGLTRIQLAEKLGVGVYDVDSWETGFFPPVEMILPLAEALGVEAEDILAGEDGADEKYGKRAEADGKDAAEGAQSPAAAQKPEAPEAPAKAEAARPAPTPVRKAKKAKKEESYYDEVNKRIAKMDPATFEQPTGDDGFSRPERIAGSVVCILFIAAVLIIFCVQLLS